MDPPQIIEVGPFAIVLLNKEVHGQARLIRIHHLLNVIGFQASLALGEIMQHLLIDEGILILGRITNLITLMISHINRHGIGLGIDEVTPDILRHYINLPIKEMADILSTVALTQLERRILAVVCVAL